MPLIHSRKIFTLMLILFNYCSYLYFLFQKIKFNEPIKTKTNLNNEKFVHNKEEKKITIKRFAILLFIFYFN